MAMILAILLGAVALGHWRDAGKTRARALLLGLILLAMVVRFLKF